MTPHKIPKVAGESELTSDERFGCIVRAGARVSQLRNAPALYNCLTGAAEQGIVEENRTLFDAYFAEEVEIACTRKRIERGV